jgi:hypothetical protein
MMSDTPFQHHPDPADWLPPDIHRKAIETLRTMLPSPIDDTPKARDRRERAALAEVVALAPASPAEARIAACHVAAKEHANDCLLLAGQLQAQGASMGRQARGYHAVLLRMRAMRAESEARQPDTAAAG